MGQRADRLVCAARQLPRYASIKAVGTNMKQPVASTSLHFSAGPAIGPIDDHHVSRADRPHVSLQCNETEFVNARETAVTRIL